jgi:hypothetical protein
VKLDLSVTTPSRWTRFGFGQVRA